MKYQIREKFGEAKSLAITLADNDGIQYGVLYSSSGYLIASEHDDFFKIAKQIKSDSLVFVAQPGKNKEEIYKRALEQIAYPENHPEFEDSFFNPAYTQRTNWMQAIAANALTNGSNK